MLDSEAAERAALACCLSFSPRPSPCDVSSPRSPRLSPGDDKEEEEVPDNKERKGGGEDEEEEESRKRRRSPRSKRKRERESREDEEDATSSLSSGSSSGSDKDEDGEELLPRARILQQAAAKSRKKSLTETSFSSSSSSTKKTKFTENVKDSDREVQETDLCVSSSSLQKASEEKENALHSASPGEEQTTPVLLDTSKTNKKKSKNSSSTLSASSTTKKLPSRGLITAPTDKADLDSPLQEKSEKKRSSTPALSLTMGDEGREGIAQEAAAAVEVRGRRKRRRIDLPKVVMNVASTEAMIEKASFPGKKTGWRAFFATHCKEDRDGGWLSEDRLHVHAAKEIEALVGGEECDRLEKKKSLYGFTPRNDIIQ